MTLLLNPLLRGISPALSPKALSNLLPRLLFRSIYGDSSGEFESPTTSRTTDLIIPDHEGILRTFGNGEVGIEGGRVVENLLSDSEDLSTGNWANDATATVTGTNTINLPAVNDTVRQEYTAAVNAGDVYVGSAVLSGSGTTTLRIARTTGGAYEETDVVVTLSSTPTRHSVTHTFANAHTKIKIQIIREAGGTATEVTATNFQLENVTGQSNQNPSEYVSSDIGKQVYATANGNTVV